MASHLYTPRRYRLLMEVPLKRATATQLAATPMMCGLSQTQASR